MVGRSRARIVTPHLNFACRQLLTTGQSFGQIAAACGLANPTQAHALLRAAIGLMPLQLRKRRRQPV